MFVLPEWALDGPKVILPRASSEKGKDLLTARQKDEGATSTSRRSSRGVAEGPRLMLPPASLEEGKDLK